MVDPSKGRVTVIPPSMVAGPGAQSRQTSEGINTGTGADWFGPLNPLAPTAPPEVAGRILDFPSGYNLNVYPRAYEGVSFAQLRALADSWDLLRLVIETRKDQMARMHWRIVPRDKKKAKAQAKGELNDPRVDALAAFLRRPDREHDWAEWLRMVLEDMFVLDAPTLYKRPTRGGALYGLEPIDGATIKRVIDDWGRTPQPPAPAFQQVLKGLPAVNYLSTEIYYKPRNPRTHKIYGYGPVEQIIMTVNIALRRQLSTLQYYTEGNVPEALIGVPDSWTPDQISAFQGYWDSLMEGNTAQRRHAKFIPSGVGKTFIATQEPELKNVFDEWLARVACFCFSISVQPFISNMNRATADSAKEASLEEGLAPTQDWVKSLIDRVIEDDFGITDLMFAWDEDEETDPDTLSQIVDRNTAGGVMSIDEGRERLGLEPKGGEAAELMVKVVTGFVPLSAYADSQTRADDAAKVAAEAAKNPPEPAAVAGVGATPPAKGEGVGKAAAIPFRKAKRLPGAPGPIPYPRPATKAAQTAFKDEWVTALESQKAEALAAVGGLTLQNLLQGATLQPDLTAIERAVAALALAAPAPDALAAQYEAVATDSGELAFAQVGSEADVFQQVNDAAAAWAKDRAAQLVTGIDETTRSQIQAAIVAGLEAGETNDEIAADLEAAFAFSPDRAQLIAYTEIATANSQGALNGYKEARAQGVNVLKEWILGENPCDECLDNADAGAIGLDEVFPSGDDAPPAHPNCECAISPVVETDDGE